LSSSKSNRRWASNETWDFHGPEFNITGTCQGKGSWGDHSQMLPEGSRCGESFGWGLNVLSHFLMIPYLICFGLDWIFKLPRQ
jgi:hypothetical protein